MMKWLKNLFDPTIKQNKKEREQIKSSLELIKDNPQLSILLKKILDKKIEIEDEIHEKYQNNASATDLENQLDEICSSASDSAVKLHQLTGKYTSFEEVKAKDAYENFLQDLGDSEPSDVQQQRQMVLKQRIDYFEQAKQFQTQLLDEIKLADETIENLQIQLSSLLNIDSPFSKPLSELTGGLFKKIEKSREMKNNIETFLNS